MPCVGYLIEHPDSGLKMVYVTDTQYVKYTFAGLTAMLIEMNHSDEYIDRNAAKFPHVIQGHLEKQTTLECIKANMNDKLQTVILCHLSSDGSDPLEFENSVREIVPDSTNVFIATPGLTVELNERNKA